MLTLGNPVPPDPFVLGQLLAQISESGLWSNGGPLGRELEALTAAKFGWRHAAATSSGTAAITAALQALRLPPGSEVITTPFTFRATPLAIEAAGLVPIFANVDPETLLLDPEAVEHAISDRVSAILPVHLFGVAVDRRIDEIAEDRGIPVIYDAAHTFGFDQDLLLRGAATAYSLHATKMLHTGEGGLAMTDNSEVWRGMLASRNFGMSAGNEAGAGTNAKLSEPAAAVGLAMWDRLDEEILKRQAVRDAYGDALARSSRLRLHAPGRERALVMEAVRCESSDQEMILAELAENGVVARVFPMLVAPGQRYEGAVVSGASITNLLQLANSVIALPIHGRITVEQLASACEVLQR